MAPRQNAAFLLVLVSAPITSASATPPCHRIDSDGVTCTQSEDADTCKASYANMVDGNCAQSDFAYCFKGAFGTELWAKGDGESCAEGLRVLKKTGYANDGCGGKSQPLPCGLSAGDPPGRPCHVTLVNDKICQDYDTDAVCNDAASQSAKAKSCADSGYALCFKGSSLQGTIELMAMKGNEESLQAACSKLQGPDNGCGGKTAALGCKPEVIATPPCHRIDSDGTTCTQSGSADTCQASYAQMVDGSCASAEYSYCFTGAFGMELWAKGDGKSCAEALVVLRKTGYSNDGCGGKSKPLPCESDKTVQV